MSAEAFDLSELARALSTDRRYGAEVRIIEEFASACSIYQDLTAASDSLRAINEIQFDDRARRTFSQALMMHAVISYSRALVSRTNNRRIIDVAGKAFSKEQRLKHAGISDLRSTALAYYHKPIGRYAAEWIDDRAVVISREGVFDPLKDVYTRSNYTKIAVEDLFELIETALVYVQTLKSRKADEVKSVLDKSSSDPFFQKKLSECQFAPNRFFPSSEATRAFWQNEQQTGEQILPRPPTR